MKINWTVRIRNKAFWLAIIPATLLLVQQIASVCGYTVELSGIEDIVGTALAILAMMGVINDPTTKGVSDSDRAMGYVDPK